MWWMDDAGWGWWVVMTVGMVAFWGLVLYGVFRLAEGGAGRREEPPRRESPHEVLRRRLAAGELSVEEYERIRRALEREERPPERALR